MEDKVRFRVDVSKVYWCSKLATERSRIIKSYLRDGQVLCDMMCGLGPLSIKSAVKVKGLRVICNDLNPEGINYCRQNIKLNKVSDRVHAFNMDARAFAKMIIEQSNLPEDKRTVPSECLRFDHVYMNLPVDAVEFLDVFRGLFRDANPAIWCEDPADLTSLKLPMIHVNGFTYKKEQDDALSYFVERIGKAMSYDF